jgi:hypothetical protein
VGKRSFLLAWLPPTALPTQSTIRYQHIRTVKAPKDKHNDNLNSKVVHIAAYYIAHA